MVTTKHKNNIFTNSLWNKEIQVVFSPTFELVLLQHQPNYFQGILWHSNQNSQTSTLCKVLTLAPLPKQSHKQKKVGPQSLLQNKIMLMVSWLTNSISPRLPSLSAGLWWNHSDGPYQFVLQYPELGKNLQLPLHLLTCIMNYCCS